LIELRAKLRRMWLRAKRRLYSLDTQRIKHIVRGFDQGAGRKACADLPTPDARQHGTSVELEHLIFHHRSGIFCGHDGREIIRGIVGEIDQFRQLQSGERTDQQTDYDREG
jgi:hypothetical protein